MGGACLGGQGMTYVLLASPGRRTRNDPNRLVPLGSLQGPLHLNYTCRPTRDNQALERVWWYSTICFSWYEIEALISCESTQLASKSHCRTVVRIPYLLAYKTPLSGASLQNLYGAQTIYHSKFLCYKTPPERGHLSRTGHIEGSYMPVDTVPSTLAMAEEAGCRHRKRQSTDQSISSWCQEVCTRKRQERDRGWSPKSLEVYATLIEAVNRRKKQKRNQGRSPKSTE